MSNDFVIEIRRSSVHEIMEFPITRFESPVYAEQQSYPKPTLWQRTREIIRAPFAEFMGVVIFVVMGTASDCQVVLSANEKVSPVPKGTFLSLILGWSAGITLGIWLSLGISGGHINPAVTLALATWKGFPWKKVPFYILAQVLGGIIGAATTYFQYRQAIDIYEGGPNIRTKATASLFAIFPADYVTALPAFMSEFLGTASLTFMIVAFMDKHEARPKFGLIPLSVLILGIAMGTALALQPFSFNPARDFGCRIFLAMAGYGKMVFTYRSQYWLWGPILAPIAGAQLAAGLYRFLRRGD